MTKRVLIPLAEGCEELEAVTLIDLFRRANLHVVTASLSEEKVVLCSRGTRLVADTSLQAMMKNELKESFELMVLPGGLPGADNLNDDPRIHQLLRETYQQGNHIAAICAAPRVFVSDDEIHVNKLTSYPGALNHLDTSHIEIKTDDVVIDGTIITSKGPGTAIAFALHLIEILLGKAARKEVEEPLHLSK